MTEESLYARHMRRGFRQGFSALLTAVILGGCAPAVPAGYDFITHSLPSGSAMDALLEGTMAVTGGAENGAVCLLVVRGSRDVTFVAWPEHFTLKLASDGTVEVHGDGNVVRQGNEVRFGGGEVTDGVRHSIPGACQNPSYFAVQSFP